MIKTVEMLQTRINILKERGKNSTRTSSERFSEKSGNWKANKRCFTAICGMNPEGLELAC